MLDPVERYRLSRIVLRWFSIAPTPPHASHNLFNGAALLVVVDNSLEHYPAVADLDGDVGPGGGR